MVFHGDQSHGTIRKKSPSTTPSYMMFFSFLVFAHSDIRFFEEYNIHVLLFQDVFLFKILRCSKRRIFQAGRCDFVTSLATETSELFVGEFWCFFFACPHMKNIVRASSSRIMKHQLEVTKNKHL